MESSLTLSPSQQWINWISSSLLRERLSDEPFQSQVLSVLRRFEELTAHLQAGNCPSAQAKAPCAPVLVVPYSGAENRKEHRKPLEPHQSESCCFPSIQAVSWSNTLFNPVSSIPWELSFALQLLSQWLIMPFGDAVKYAVLLQLWVMFIHWRIHGL